MRSNYAPWSVNLEAYCKLRTLREKLFFILNFAVLAPSSHNSQPWIFSIDENSILILPNADRMLRVGDKENRLLYISLGCALKNILVAADFFGFFADVSYVSDAQTDLVSIKVNFSVKESEPDFVRKKEHLIFFIPKRSVNRGRYEFRAPEKSFMDRLQVLSNDRNVLTLVGDPVKKEIIADCAVDASVLLMDNKSFREELSHYVKNNLTRSSIGIPAFGMGIPTVVSFFVPLLLRYLNLDRLDNKKARTLLKKFTPVLGIFSTNGDSVTDWIETGKFYQEVALLSEKEGLKTAVFAAPILVDTYVKKIQGVCNLKTRPQLLIRIGYPLVKQHHSPRLNVLSVIK